MSLMRMTESHGEMRWDSLPISTQIDIEAAAHNDDWQKLVWLIETSVVTFEGMVFHIFSLNLEDPLVNVLIAFEKKALALEVIEVLPDFKLKELEKKNFKGDTALHVAATMENITVARAMLDKHPRLIFMTNNLNETPLHKAALNGHRDMFWELLVRGSNVRARRYDGATVLHCAVMDHHFKLALEIAQGYPDLIELRDQLGLTVLHHMVTMIEVFGEGRELNLTPIQSFFYNCIVIEKQDTSHPKSEKDEEKCVNTPFGKNKSQPIEDDFLTDGIVIEKQDTSHPKSEADEEKCVNTPFGKNKSQPIEDDFLTDGFPMGSMKGITGRDELLEDDTQNKKTLNTVDELEVSSNSFMEFYKATVKKIKLQITRTMMRLNIRSLIELKKKHEFAHDLLTLIANKSGYWTSLSLGSYKEITHRQKKPDNIGERWMETPLTLGAKMGLDQLVIEILQQHPGAAKYLGNDGKNILHVAIENRQEGILQMVESSLIKKNKVEPSLLGTYTTEQKGLKDPRLIYWLTSTIDNFGNTILHLAARPMNKTSSSMQMVEEFKWFERVKKLMPGDLVNHRNDEGKTALEVFSESHKEMVEDGKLQLTNTARSACAALVSAVTFAAGFSIASDQEKKLKKGNPYDRVAFNIFSHSYMVGLSCGAMALVQFMSLLMSSYTEQDFRRAIPTQYFLAIISLFLAMLSMLVAFACNTYVSLYGGSSPNWKTVIPMVCEVIIFPLVCLAILSYQGVRFRLFSIFKSLTR